MIEKIRFKNFRKFENTEINLNEDRNILVGENGVGKSSILLAIQLVLSGSDNLISVHGGLTSLMNSNAINNFLSKESKKIDDLPEMYVELYFTEKDNFRIDGCRNSLKSQNSGIRLIATYNRDYCKEIEKAINSGISFPFEYYSIKFETFDGSNYSSYNRKHHLKYNLIDTSTINNKSAMSKFIHNLYYKQSKPEIRSKISHEFRELTEQFSRDMYDSYSMDRSNSEYQLKLDVQNNSDFSKDITAVKNGVRLCDAGQGEQVILSVMASNGGETEEETVLLIEEPENYLSYNNMQLLIHLLETLTNVSQTIIATHSSMIATRLDVSKLLMLSKTTDKIQKLENVSLETVSYFKKAPSNDFLKFLLANKVILIEGDAEYILMDKFFEILTKHRPYEEGISIISCNGRSFKRYLEVAKKLNKKSVVITDNDSELKNNSNFVSVSENYENYINNICNVYTDSDSKNYTFEVSIYNNNSQLLESEFKNKHMTNGLLSYMLSNKTDSALKLLTFLDTDKKYSFNIPNYIEEAIKWIRD